MKTAILVLLFALGFFCDPVTAASNCTYIVSGTAPLAASDGVDGTFSLLQGVSWTYDCAQDVVSVNIGNENCLTRQGFAALSSLASLGFTYSRYSSDRLDADKPEYMILFDPASNGFEEGFLTHSPGYATSFALDTSRTVLNRTATLAFNTFALRGNLTFSRPRDTPEVEYINDVQFLRFFTRSIGVAGPALTRVISIPVNFLSSQLYQSFSGRFNNPIDPENGKSLGSFNSRPGQTPAPSSWPSPRNVSNILFGKFPTFSTLASAFAVHFGQLISFDATKILLGPRGLIPNSTEGSRYPAGINYFPAQQDDNGLVTNGATSFLDLDFLYQFQDNQRFDRCELPSGSLPDLSGMNLGFPKRFANPGDDTAPEINLAVMSPGAGTVALLFFRLHNWFCR